MSWVTVVWSMAAAATLTLAGIHLLVWVKKRTAWTDLVFSLTALAAAGMAATEMWMMRAVSPQQFATALRWGHLPVWAASVGLVLFVRLYLRAGRAWLAWGVIALRTVSLVVDFLVGPNINYRVVSGLRHVPFLGEPVTIPVGVPNPLMLLAQSATFLLIVFVADAARSAWRRGDRRAAVTVGGSIILFVLAAVTTSALSFWQIITLPLINSFFYLIVNAAMAAELTRDTIRAARLSDDLRESEARYRSILERSSEGIYRTSAEGRILFANPATAKILGYDSPEELISSVTDVSSQVWAVPEERSRLVRLVEEGGMVRGHECRFKRKDGTQVWVLLSTRPFRGPDGRISYFDGIFTNIDERKRADEGRRQSEERFRALAESSLVGIYILQDGQYVYVNPAMARVFGYSVAEMTGMTPREIVQSSDHGTVGENIRRRITGEVQAIQYEVKGRYKDGSTRDVEVYGSRIEMNGRPALVGTLVDITARKQVEESLTRIQNLLAETEKIGRVGGWEFQIDTQELTWTPEVYAIHEVEPSSPMTMERAMEFITPGSRERILRLVGAAVHEGRPYDTELELVTAKGHRRIIHTIGKADPDGRRVYGFFQDITERKQAEEALSKSRGLLEEIEKIGRVGGWEIDIRTMKQTWTPEVYSIHEVEPSFEPTVENGIAFYASESRPVIARLVRRAIEFGEPFDAELEIITAKGRRRSVHAVGRTDLQRNRVYGFFQDITERKHSELELAELRAERTHMARVLTVDEISTSLAHEINQPLGAIMNNAEAAQALLSRPEGNPGLLAEIVDDIIADAKRAGDVVRKVRGILKKGEARYERLSVGPLVDEVLAIMNNSLALNGVAPRLELGTGLADVRGDRVRLQQVMINLITNAIDAMKEAPTKLLTVRSAMDGTDMVIVSVGDTGPGIRGDRRNMIFQPYFTTKKGGLGLGLSICRSIIEEHGGRIWANDGPDGGAVFSVSLKACKEGSS